MRGSSPLVLLLVLLVPAWAGCVAPTDDAPSAEELGIPSAQEAFDDALAAFHAEGIDPVLFGLTGIEAATTGAFFTDLLPETLRPEGIDDMTAADGRTTYWLGFWKSTDGTPYITRQGAADVEILAGPDDDTYPFGTDHVNHLAGPVPVGHGWMDSTRAMDRVLRISDDVEKAVERFDVDILLVLQRGPDRARPAWTIVVSPVQSDERFVGVVDAIDGSSITARDLYGQRSEPRARTTYVIGPYDNTRIVRLGEGAGRLLLTFEPFTDGSPFALQVDLTHPDGRIERLDTSTWPAVTQVARYALVAGAYTVTMVPVLDAGAAAVPTADLVTLTVCAGGRLPDPSGLSWRGTCDNA